MIVRTKSQNWDAGSSQVEFVFSIFFMLVVLLTLMELCNAVYTYVVLSDAANEGVRYAIVHSTDGGSLTSNVQNKVITYARNAFSIGTLPSSDVTVTCPDGACTVPNRVQVSVSYVYAPFAISGLRNFSINPPTMHAYAEGRLVY